MNTESLNTALVFFQENAETISTASYKIATLVFAGAIVAGYTIKRLKKYFREEIHTRDEHEVMIEYSPAHQKKLNAKVSQEYKEFVEDLKENPIFLSNKSLADNPVNPN